MYTWFGSSLLLLAVPMIFMENNKGICRWALIIMVPLMIGALWAMAVGKSTNRYWYKYNQITNGHTLTSLSSLQHYVQPGSRVLMAGAFNAFSPMKNDAFIRSRFDFELDWRVTVPKIDLPLLSGSHDTQRLIPASEVKPENFDLIAYFSHEGYLLRIGKPEELVSLDASHRLANLLCQNLLTDPTGCLTQLGETEATAQLSSTQPLRTCSADDIRYISGWYERGSEGVWMRQDARLHVPACGCELRATFYLPDSFSARELVVGPIDRASGGAQRFSLKPGQVMDLRLPAAKQATMYALHTSAVTIPSRDLGSADQRELSVLASGMRFSCVAH
jgi:hypothetical protein